MDHKFNSNELENKLATHNSALEDALLRFMPSLNLASFFLKGQSQLGASLTCGNPCSLGTGCLRSSGGCLLVESGVSQT